ncbi:hypothetical protein [Moorena sp. SIO3B2]|uniref:hypothetical protein n=1 Tax=Moorena sp. SIO3B2 TaxID=2607827 RepID=UPI0013C9B284|nr:hypothetical protein [Moorena sp. SIO3B2]NEP37258.1 hypothetical protein [Moorena sp. SIO3B2]
MLLCTEFAVIEIGLFENNYNRNLMRLAVGHATRVTRSQSVAYGLSFRACAIDRRSRYAIAITR